MRQRVRRGVVLAATSLVTAGLLPFTPSAVTPPARASHDDGPPILADGGNDNQGLAFNPMTVPTSGGFTRIYGSGFHGVTSVVFGGRPSPKFGVVTENIIFAQVPPGNNNTFATVTIRDSQGSDSNRSFYYTDATASARPSTGLTNGASLVFDVEGYRPNITAAIAEASPVVGFAWPRPLALPPPYVDPITVNKTDSVGGLSDSSELAPAVASGPCRGGPGDPSAPYDGCQMRVSTSPEFNAGDDPKATCPPTQEQANLGLVTCSLAWSEFGKGVIAAPISFRGNPTPQAPTVALSASTAKPGATVTVSGVNWNANPNFGSSTSQQWPGETPLRVEICGLEGDVSRCSPTTGTGSVRYVLYEVGEVNGHEGRLTGSTLEGSIYVDGNLSQGCSNCFLRVRQHRFNNPAEYIEATAPLSVQPGEAPSSTTTTVPSTTTTVPTTTSTTTTSTTVPTVTVTPGGVVPDFGSPGGGTPVRIYGSGFCGNDRSCSDGNKPTVTFGSSRATKVTPVDDTLITAVTPPGRPGRSTVTVTTESGTARLAGEEGFYYGDPTVKVSPDANLRPGQEVSGSWSDFPVYVIYLVEEASPLSFVVEPRPFPTPSDQMVLARIVIGMTDANFRLANPFQANDAAAKCPPTQEQANAGLVNCSIMVHPSGPQGGSQAPARRLPNVPAPIAFAGQTAPQPPTLELERDAATGEVRLRGRNWSASPGFGSSASPEDEAGATLLEVEICGVGGSPGCKPAVTAEEVQVPLTRYKYDYTCKAGKLEGGRLEGSIAADENLAQGFVRVRQYRADNGNESIEATALLSQAKPLTSTTTTALPAATGEECPGGAGRVTPPTTIPIPPMARTLSARPPVPPTPTATAPAMAAAPPPAPATPRAPRTEQTTTVTTSASVANLAVSPSPPEPPPSRGVHSLFGPGRPGGSPVTGQVLAAGVLALVAGLILLGRRFVRARLQG